MATGYKKFLASYFHASKFIYKLERNRPAFYSVQETYTKRKCKSMSELLSVCQWFNIGLTACRPILNHWHTRLNNSVGYSVQC